MLLLVLAGCDGALHDGAPLRVTIVGDPARPGGLAERLAAQATSATLITRDGAGQTLPGLATSWRFVGDGRSLILRLRPVQWSNGKALTSNDVMAAFRRAAAPPRSDGVFADAGLSAAAAVASGRAPATQLGIRAPIARVVELRLDAASPLLLGWLAEPAMGVVPAAKAAESKSTAKAAENRSGATSAASAATLAAYTAGGTADRRVLTRIADVVTPEARPGRIIISGSDDAAAAVAAFGQDKTDIVIGEGLSGLGEARMTARPQALRIDPLWGVYGYLANGVHGPLRDDRVRRALAMAIDRPALVGRFGITAMAPVAALLPPSLSTRLPVADPPAAAGTPIKPAVAGRANDTDWTGLGAPERLAQAQTLLASAGWTAATPLRLVLLLPPGSDHRRVAELVAADWARLGVVLAVTQVGIGTIDRLVARGDFDLAVSEASVPVPDAGALLARYRCGAGPFCNPAVDTLLAQARLAPPADRPALLARANAVLMTAPPLIPLFSAVRWALVGPQVDGWVPNVAGSHPLARLAIMGQH